VDVFNPPGQRSVRLQSGPWFNAPWELAMASGEFGESGHSLDMVGSGKLPHSILSMVASSDS
jgi:hypothetical protein